MKYAISRRTATGSVERTVLDAANRAAALSIAKRNGWNVIGCEAVGDGAAVGGSSGSNSKVKIMVALSLLLVVAVLAWIFLSEPNPTKETKPPSSPKKIERPTAPKRPQPAVTAPKPEPVPAPEPVKEYVTTNRHGQISRGDGKVHYETNGVGEVIRIARDGTRSIMVFHKNDQKGGKPLFKNHVEQVLSYFAIPGEDVPPLPDLFTKEELDEALSKSVDIDLNNDSEEDVIRKQAVMELKEQLREAIKNGMTLEDFMRRVAERQASEAFQVRESRAMIMQELRQGNAAEARALYEKLNEHLEKQGIPKLRFASKFRKQMGLED